MFVQSSISESVVLGPATSAIPGNLLGMQILWFNPRLQESETLGTGLSNLFLQALQVPEPLV